MIFATIPMNPNWEQCCVYRLGLRVTCRLRMAAAPPALGAATLAVARLSLSASQVHGLSSGTSRLTIFDAPSSRAPQAPAAAGDHGLVLIARDDKSLRHTQ